MALSSHFAGLLAVSSLSAIALLPPYSAQPAAAQTVANGSLTVALSGLSNTNGQICVSLFDNSGGFPDDSDAVVAQQCVAADGSTPTQEMDTDTGNGSAAEESAAEESGAEELGAEELEAEDLEAEESAAEESAAEGPEAAEIVETKKPEASESEQADVVITFPNLVSGTYAVAVLHDENGDQQMNQGAFGIPAEGFGFSRNPMITTSAPDFSEVAIFVLGDITTDVELIYF